MGKRSNAFISMNANFFDESNTPLGLVMKDQKILVPLRPVSWWGVFSIRNSSPSIVHTTEFFPNPATSMAIQAGPRLVIKGTIPKLKNGFSRKTAVGISRKGEIVLIVTERPVEMSHFAEYLSLSERKGGLGLVDALNLDGGGSTQLYATIDSFSLNVAGYSGIPVALGVFEK